jgi:hypothetical protein
MTNTETQTEALVASIPEAGKLAGLSPAASYRAAKAGDMPVILINGRKVVPLKLWRRILDGEG